ncbi:YdeI/OmpD-associated family protein [Roseivivax sp. CAU 1753]
MTETPEVARLLNTPRWQQERLALRALMLECGLEERVKWGKLCYLHDARNVVIIYGLKGYCALGFFKGALLEDDDNALVAPGAHSQAMRQLRFAGLDDITARADQIRAYVTKAIDAEKAGLSVDFAARDSLDHPVELQDVLDADAAFSKAFEALTPGRRRGYVLHFSNAAKSETRRARVAKSRPRIIAGKGLNDR